MGRIVFLVAAFVSVSVRLHAQPTGPLHYAFSNTQLPLWDLTGTYTTTNDIGVIQVTYQHRPSGQVTGVGTADLNSSGSQLHVTEISVGRVIGGATTRLMDAGRGTFTGMARCRAIAGTFRGSEMLVLDPTNRTLAGREMATLCFAGQCLTEKTNATFALQPDMTGSWTLDLTLTATNNHVTGAAAVTLSNGRAVPFAARGRFTPATGITKLRLGNAITVTLDQAGTLQTLQGRLFGQPLKLQ